MNLRSPVPSTAFALLAALAACTGGGDGSSGGTDGGSGSGSSGGSGTSAGSASTGGSGGSSAGSTTTAGSSSGTSTTAGSSSGTSTTAGSSGGAACTSWLVTYDLTGSSIHIDALADFDITVQEPYDENLNTGPGSITLRFQDDGGAPALDGPVSIVEYTLTQNFVTGNNFATVTTEMQTWSGPEACGTANGTLAMGTATWTAPAQMDPYCRDGTVSCVGSFCGMYGAPPENMPFEFMNDCSVPLAVNDFVFTAGIDAFFMEPAIMSMDANQTVTIAFVGTKTDETEDPATPQCGCG